MRGIVRLLFATAEHQDRKDAAERERRITEMGQNWTMPARQSWRDSGEGVLEDKEYAGLSDEQIREWIHQRMLYLSDDFRKHVSARNQDGEMT